MVKLNTPKISSKKFWRFRNQTEESADLLLYGLISSETWYGDEVTPKQFAEDLRALGDVKRINVFINSDGGDVFAGQAIHSMLKRHPAEIIVYVDGLAASIASVVAMAGDRVIMPRNAMMMIHSPMIAMCGFFYASELRAMAEDLDQIRESIIAVYQEKTGLERSEIISLMNAETWLTAEGAVAKGFADEIEQTKEIAAVVRGGRLMVNGVPMDLLGQNAEIMHQLAFKVVNEKRKWSKKEAEDWLKEHDFKTSDYEKLPNYHSFRQNDPGKYDEFRTNTSPFDFEEDDGVIVIYGIYTEDGERKTEIQTIKFYHGEADSKKEEDKEDKKNKKANKRNDPRINEQTENGLLDLYKAKLQINKNKLKG